MVKRQLQKTESFDSEIVQYCIDFDIKFIINKSVDYLILG